MVASWDAPMRVTGCRGDILPTKLPMKQRFIAVACHAHF
jgi:23S rRNA C2498 (ribose-2'-O)-methylase RlmM